MPACSLVLLLTSVAFGAVRASANEGRDHQQLTSNCAGRDFRLTDVAGNVEKAILA